MSTSHIGPWRTPAQGHLTVDENGDAQTDYARWRLLDDRGRQTWHYLESDEESEKWPQSVADKYFLGLPTVGFLYLLSIETTHLNLDHVGTSGFASSENSIAGS